MSRCRSLVFINRSSTNSIQRNRLVSLLQHRSDMRLKATTALFLGLSGTGTDTNIGSFTHAFSISTMNMSSSSSSSSAAAASSSKLCSSAALKGDSTSSSSPQKQKQDEHPLSNLLSNFDHTWVKQLSKETQSNRLKSQQMSSQDDGISNNVRRPVYNGHYVLVKPKPLQNPRLVISSPDMVQRLGLDPKSTVGTDNFVKYFSGDVYGAFEGELLDNNNNDDERIRTWATPYALSIMGRRYTSNCPYGTGDGYGDGRAISIGEVRTDETSTRHGQIRYELQLKGAGPTPFCRGADGRAVLRSSIREFLASEAMFYLGVDTTRALSLIVSGDGGDTSSRPWYSDKNKKTLPELDDPRLAKYSMKERKQIISQLNAQTKNDPDIMIEEPCAITTRCAQSFVRIGHIDLFARRATKEVMDNNTKPNTETNEFKELEDLVWHACYREFAPSCYDEFKKDSNILSASKCLLEKSLDGISTMVADWIRVGFVQGNFNADNAAVAGRTLDYGPFGWMDEYHPTFAKWTGSGDHYGFMNQPNAGYANYAVLVASIMPIIEAYSSTMEEANAYKDEIMERSQEVFESKVLSVFRRKLGFHPEDESADELWPNLEALMRDNRVDWTMFWRQLTIVMKEYPIDTDDISTEYGDMLELLIANDEIKAGSSPFYQALSEEGKADFLSWIELWRKTLVGSYDENGSSTVLSKKHDETAFSPYERMRTANPKYILREWMLVEAYTKASPSIFQSPTFLGIGNDKSVQGDESMIHELFDLIQNPYDEGSDEQDEKYYRRASEEALKSGGTAFMS